MGSSGQAQAATPLEARRPRRSPRGRSRARRPVELALLAETDPDVKVRRAAVAEVTDPAVLGRVAAGDADAETRDRAADRLVGACDRTGHRRGDGAAAPSRALTDPRRLSTIAKSDAPDAVRADALSRLTDERALGSIARHAKHEATAAAALDRLTSHEELSRSRRTPSTRTSRWRRSSALSTAEHAISRCCESIEVARAAEGREHAARARSSRKSKRPKPRAVAAEEERRRREAALLRRRSSAWPTSTDVADGARRARAADARRGRRSAIDRRGRGDRFSARHGARATSHRAPRARGRRSGRARASARRGHRHARGALRARRDARRRRRARATGSDRRRVAIAPAARRQRPGGRPAG